MGGFKELTEEVARRVWIIECADVLIPKDEAIRRFEAMPDQGSNRKIQIRWTVGCALIALQDMGKIQYAPSATSTVCSTSPPR